MECFVLHPKLKVLNDEGENNGDSEHQNKESKILASSKGVGTQTQKQKVRINEETKMMDFQNRGTGRQQRNPNLQVWNVTKDMRVFNSNKGKKPQAKKIAEIPMINYFAALDNKEKEQVEKDPKKAHDSSC
ncbi:hypothetical protein KY285_031415 [Solanum tuberosum]|nr:hypothetical protein KY284_031203 [Solanum tuberosum]KAH0656533.1 hypothetical protein KY285_031415 [Solanum tuberosum]